EKGVLTDEEYALKTATIKDKLFGIKKDSTNTANLNAVNEAHAQKKVTEPNITPINTDENSNKTLYTTFTIIFLLLCIGAIFFYTRDSYNNSNQENSVVSNSSEKNQEQIHEQKSSTIENPFLGKYFYVSTSVYTEFDTFFETTADDKFVIIYFETISTVVCFAYIGDWQKGVAGRYKYKNGKIIMKVPFYIIHEDDKSFGGDVKILNDSQIIASVDGHLRVKFLRYIPPK
ncbi:MAG TPA: hypothetical protein VF411_03830, partial [Bacteroidia bacterium]